MCLHTCLHTCRHMCLHTQGRAQCRGAAGFGRLGRPKQSLASHDTTGPNASASISMPVHMSVHVCLGLCTFAHMCLPTSPMTSDTLGTAPQWKFIFLFFAQGRAEVAGCSTEMCIPSVCLHVHGGMWHGTGMARLSVARRGHGSVHHKAAGRTAGRSAAVQLQLLMGQLLAGQVLDGISRQAPSVLTRSPRLVAIDGHGRSSATDDRSVSASSNLADARIRYAQSVLVPR